MARRFLFYTGTQHSPERWQPKQRKEETYRKKVAHSHPKKLWYT